MTAGYYDANGVYQYGESDPIALYSDFMNLGQASVSSQFTNDRARLATLENTITTANRPNILLNSAMEVWQRGTSFPSGGFTADRWYCVGGAYAQEATDVPSGFSYALKGTATASQLIYHQVVETINTVLLAGKTVTLSAYMKASLSTSIVMDIQYSTSVDNPVTGGGWTTVTSFTKNVTTSYSRQEATFVIPSTAKTFRVRFLSGAITGSVYITGTQLEEGVYATPFRRNGPTFSAELASCQRYYQRIVASTAYGLFGVAHSYNSTIFLMMMNHIVPLRTPVSSIDFSGSFRLNNGPTQWNVTGATFSFDSTGSTKNITTIYNTVASITAGTQCWMDANNSPTAYIGLNAEI